MEPVHGRFPRHVPADGRILDAGCGSGRDAKQYAKFGYEVEARERSAVIADEARLLTELGVGVEEVLEMADDAHFDGI
jgi:SAM-dependent methyltransferase